MAIIFPFLGGARALAQHDHSDGAQVKVPRLFLDKSPRIVEYQLKRLTNEQLLAIETSQDDKKYVPVFQAILTREGMSRAYREQALASLVALNGSNNVLELTAALKSLDPKATAAGRTVKTLAALLLQQSPDALISSKEALLDLASGEGALLGPVGFAGLLSAGLSADSEAIASQTPEARVRMLSAIALIESGAIKNTLHTIAYESTRATSADVQRAALQALSHINAEPQSTFERAAELVVDEGLQDAAVKTLLSVEPVSRTEATSLALVKFLVEHAEATPAAERTTESFLDAMELVEQLLAAAPTPWARDYRKRLRETVVRVVRIHTVEEEMRYDIPFFAVEAGRPVQVVLINEDLMPHNLVITAPGALKEVAEEGLAVGPSDGLDGKAYVPHSEKVLFATSMIPTLESERLTFQAPDEPGEYPYVCTFPRHWMRMYGVMVVVEDLDAWLKDPIEPKDPIGSNRSFVQSWTMNDFPIDVAQDLRGRSPKIGEKIFVEATCAQCHKLGEIGVGNVGPNLAESFERYRGDARAVLQEILDPSHRIDEKYAVHLVLDVDGQTYSGLLLDEDKQQVQLLENPEAKEPTIIAKDDIEQMVKTANSMMPKGLMDRFSKDEIYELLSFLSENQR